MDKKEVLINHIILQRFKNIFAFTTSRLLFENQSPRFTGDFPEIFNENREKLAHIIGIKAQMLIFPRQTHSCTVKEIKEIQTGEIRDTDALITSERGICLCVQTADCVPVLLFDPVKHVIAAVYAGWRGTVRKIAGATVNKLIENFGTESVDLIASIGPSIGPEVYEVGDEVVELVMKNFSDTKLLLIKNNSGKFNFNLWEANRQILIQSGLKEQNIHIMAECSYQQNSRYFSARREGHETGRMVSGIMLR